MFKPTVQVIFRIIFQANQHSFMINDHNLEFESFVLSSLIKAGLRTRKNNKHTDVTELGIVNFRIKNAKLYGISSYSWLVTVNTKLIILNQCCFTYHIVKIPTLIVQILVMFSCRNAKQLWEMFTQPVQFANRRYGAQFRTSKTRHFMQTLNSCNK